MSGKFACRGESPHSQSATTDTRCMQCQSSKIEHRWNNRVAPQAQPALVTPQSRHATASRVDGTLFHRTLMNKQPRHRVEKYVENSELFRVERARTARAHSTSSVSRVPPNLVSRTLPPPRIQDRTEARDSMKHVMKIPPLRTDKNSMSIFSKIFYQLYQSQRTS